MSAITLLTACRHYFQLHQNWVLLFFVRSSASVVFFFVFGALRVTARGRKQHGVSMSVSTGKVCLCARKVACCALLVVGAGVCWMVIFSTIVFLPPCKQARIGTCGALLGCPFLSSCAVGRWGAQKKGQRRKDNSHRHIIQRQCALIVMEIER